MTFLRIDSKTVLSAHDRQRLITRAARAAVGIPTPLPVMAYGKTIGWVQGSRRSQRTRVLECGFPTVDDVIREMTRNNKAHFLTWHKCITSGGLATPDWHHLFAVAGDPGPGSFGSTAKTFVPHSDLSAGAMFHGSNVNPDTKHMLSAFIRLAGANPSTAEQACFLVYDLVGTYDQCDFASTSQTLTTGTTPGVDYPARYVSAGEEGLQIYPVTTGANGNAVYTNIIYTDNEGTATQSAVVAGLQSVFTGNAPTATNQWPSAAEYSGSLSALDIPLAVGDSGVRKLESYQFGSSIAGAFSLVLAKPITMLPTQGGDWTSVWDFVMQIPSTYQIKDGACLTLAVHSVSLGGMYTGGFQVAWG